MIVEVRLCDQDEAEDERTGEERTFALDGTEYSIDLCLQHGEEFDLTFGRWVAAARKVGRVKSESRTQAQRDLAARVRAWALEAGLITEDKGRMPDSVWTAYRAAHPS